MLKLALFLALVSVAFAADELVWDKIPGAANSSQCIYRVDTRQISCRGPREVVVECPAVLETAALGQRRYEVFGLCRVEGEVADLKAESRRYWLYPREIDNTTYLDRRVEVDGKSVELYLYYGEKTSETGLRVTDLKCYERLVELYTSSVINHEVKVLDRTVSLFGEILVADKPAHKRWLGWLSPWSWGWGWGLGWGYPYWGYGLLG